MEEVCRAHLDGLPPDFAALASHMLVLRRPDCGNPERELLFPCHLQMLARWSCHIRTLQGAIEDGAVASCSDAAAAAALSGPLAGSRPEDVSAFLKLLYGMPSRQKVSQALCSVQQSREQAEVIFSFDVEPLLRLAQAYDCPEVFEVAEQALLEEPALKLAVLMSPIKWLLLFDEYRHLGHFSTVRSAAISHLSAKFAALQSDPALAQLSPATLADLVRMLGYRLDTLSQTCSHVQAVQERSMQRFSAMAQEVAAPYCPTRHAAGAFVTHWACATTSKSIKLSWTLEPTADQAVQAAQHAQHAQLMQQAAMQQQHHHHHHYHLQVPVVELPQLLVPPPAPQPPAPELAPLPPPQPPAAAPAPHPHPGAVPSVGQLLSSWQAVKRVQAAVTQRQAVLSTVLSQVEAMQEERLRQLTAQLLAGAPQQLGRGIGVAISEAQQQGAVEEFPEEAGQEEEQQTPAELGLEESAEGSATAASAAESAAVDAPQAAAGSSAGPSSTHAAPAQATQLIEAAEQVTPQQQAGAGGRAARSSSSWQSARRFAPY